jgi:hypothetical protein
MSSISKVLDKLVDPIVHCKIEKEQNLNLLTYFEISE